MMFDRRETNRPFTKAEITLGSSTILFQWRTCKWLYDKNQLVLGALKYSDNVQWCKMSKPTALFYASFVMGVLKRTRAYHIKIVFELRHPRRPNVKSQPNCVIIDYNWQDIAWTSAYILSTLRQVQRATLNIVVPSVHWRSTVSVQ